MAQVLFCVLLLHESLHCLIAAFCLVLHFVLNRDIQTCSLSENGSPSAGLEICSSTVMHK